jgi:hypothetical protein
MQRTTVLLRTFIKPSEIRERVTVAKESRLTAVASVDDMGRNARQIKPRFTWHSDILVCCLGVVSIAFRIGLRVLTSYLGIGFIGGMSVVVNP